MNSLLGYTFQLIMDTANYQLREIDMWNHPIEVHYEILRLIDNVTDMFDTAIRYNNQECPEDLYQIKQNFIRLLRTNAEDM